MKNLFRVTIAIVIFAVLIWLGDGVAAHWEVMTRLGAYGLILTMLAITAGRTVMAYKWLRLLRCRGSDMPLRTATQIYCAANVWGLFLPATVGADAVRTVCACREGLNGHTVLASMLIERGLGFIVSCLLCLLAVLYLAGVAPLGATLYYTGWLAAALLAGLVITLWLSFTESVYNVLHGVVLRRFAHRKPVRLLRELHTAYREYAYYRREMVIFSALTLVESAVTAAAFWFIARSLEVDVALPMVLAATFLANLAARVPLSIGGFGVFEAMFVLTLSLSGIPSTEALSIALLGQVLKILSWLPWWFAYTASAGSFSAPDSVSATSGGYQKGTSTASGARVPVASSPEHPGATLSR